MLKQTVAAIFIIASQARAAGTAPRFEIATLKQSSPAGDSYPITLGVVQNGRLILTNVTLSDCIKFAYGLVSDDQISGPDWIRSSESLFDIVAQVPSGTPRVQVLLMTQSLLADRLNLVVHHEQKDLRHLELVLGKRGPKMPPALDESIQPRNNSAGHGHVTGNQMSVQLLATLLSRIEHEIVIDKTGLNGEFQIKLQWQAGTGSPTTAPDDHAEGSSLFTAIEEQLGLKLLPHKGPLDILVVDHADKIPAEN